MALIHLIFGSRSLQLSLEDGCAADDVAAWPPLLAAVLWYAFGERDAFIVADTGRVRTMDWIAPPMRLCGSEVADGTLYQLFYAPHCDEQQFVKLTRSVDFSEDAVWVAQPVARRGEIGTVVASVHHGTTLLWLNVDRSRACIRRDISNLVRAYGCSLQYRETR